MQVSRKALLLGLMLAAGAATAPGIASAGISIDIDVAPLGSTRPEMAS